MRFSYLWGLKKNLKRRKFPSNTTVQKIVYVGFSFSQKNFMNKCKSLIMDPQIQQKILQFETFINDVLKADLAKLAEKLNTKNADVAEFLQLKSVITTFQNTNVEKTGFKTKVDIRNNFFIQAHVPDASKILLDVGLGHYIEFTLNEALIVINIRITLLEQQIANLRKAIARTNAHIKLILIAIRDLQGMRVNI